MPFSIGDILAYPQRFQRIETSDEQIKRGIVEKIANTQVRRDNLFYALNFLTENTPKIRAFQDFITAFHGLFQDTKDNIGRSLKIKKDWKTKEKRYGDYFKDKVGIYSVGNMNDGMELFEEFKGDMVKVDLYKILEEAGEGGESSDFEGDEEIIEEEGIDSG